MLSRLAERLQAQSLAENSSTKEQVDDRDSGTESDDDQSKILEIQKTMANVFRCNESRLTRLGKKQLNDSLEGHRVQETTRSRRNQGRKTAHKDDDDDDVGPPEGMGDSGLPSDSDHNVEYHSSEEELEMINCRGDVSDDDVKSDAEDTCNNKENSGYDGDRSNVVVVNNVVEGQRGDTTIAKNPNKKREKRKWSEIHSFKNCKRHNDDPHDGDDDSSSGDDEVRDLMVYHLTAPVQFRSSPPADVYKPSRYSVSPPPKFMHISSAQLTPFEVCSVSSRSTNRRKQRTARQRNHNIQRSYLDFDKMRQVQVGML